MGGVGRVICAVFPVTTCCEVVPKPEPLAFTVPRVTRETSKHTHEPASTERRSSLTSFQTEQSSAAVREAQPLPQMLQSRRCCPTTWPPYCLLQPQAFRRPGRKTQRGPHVPSRDFTCYHSHKEEKKALSCSAHMLLRAQNVKIRTSSSWEELRIIFHS